VKSPETQLLISRKAGQCTGMSPRRVVTFGPCLQNPSLPTPLNAPKTAAISLSGIALAPLLHLRLNSDLRWCSDSGPSSHVPEPDVEFYSLKSVPLFSIYFVRCCKFESVSYRCKFVKFLK